jgi:IS6 family transposase
MLATETRWSVPPVHPGCNDWHAWSAMTLASCAGWVSGARGAVALGDASVSDTDRMISSTSGSSAPAGYRFPREVAVAVRWYLSYGLSYRDVEELLAERGIEVDHITVYRWVQTFTAQFINAAARPARHAVGDRWFVDETYVKVASRWTYLYRAVDQRGQVIDVLVSTRRNAPAARAFFARALRLGPVPVEVVTDRAPVYPRLLNDLMPAARHITERYATDEMSRASPA